MRKGIPCFIIDHNDMKRNEIKNRDLLTHAQNNIIYNSPGYDCSRLARILRGNSAVIFSASFNISSSFDVTLFVSFCALRNPP